MLGRDFIIIIQHAIPYKNTISYQRTECSHNKKAGGSRPFPREGFILSQSYGGGFFPKEGEFFPSGGSFFPKGPFFYLKPGAFFILAGPPFIGAPFLGSPLSRFTVHRPRQRRFTVRVTVGSITRAPQA